MPRYLKIPVTGLFVLALLGPGIFCNAQVIDKQAGDSIYKLLVQARPGLPRNISSEDWNNSGDPRHRKIVAFLAELADAVESRQESAINRHCSLDHMLLHAFERGMLDLDINADSRPASVELGKRIAWLWLGTMAWDQHDIQAIEFTDDNTAVLHVRHWNDSEEYYTYMRWWLVRTDAGWKFFDVENREYQLRASTLLGQAEQAIRNDAPWWNDFRRFMQARDEITVEEALSRMEDVLAHELPSDILGYILSLKISALLQLPDRENDALDLVDKLEDLHGDYPIVAYLRSRGLADLGEYEEASVSLENYADVFGWDSDTCEAAADIYWALDENAQAAEFAEKGLHDNPRAWGCLASLAVTLPADQKSRLDPHFANLDNGENVMDYVIAYALNVDDMDAALHVYRLLRKYHAESEVTRNYQSQFDQ